jgi:uncharacterized hydrophobic protein (TIGR00271 family)
MTALRERFLPAHQLRDVEDLTDRLDLLRGDRGSKTSAFWTMLVLSGIIAVAGVLADSTATVIGAMIVAPLSTPIMGIAAGVVRGEARLVVRSAVFVLGGVLVVVATGYLAGLLLPSTSNLLTNSQVTGRTSPGLLDMLAALATGFAGAVGLARRDVSEVLPGVAIAISLVPPLGVVGVCLGRGMVALSLGAFLLFASNVLALVLAGTLVFTASGYSRFAGTGRFSRRRAYLALAVGAVLVLVPLAANTLATWVVAVWEERIHTVAAQWIDQAPGGRVVDVTFESRTAVIDVELPGTLPDTAELVAALAGKVPDGVEIVVDAGTGERLTAGLIGG